ncbi:MAG: YkwD protein, partial [Candidatus Paceibacter sp.]|nr:YkwD protein [Candidatus Paceibacter sp.]
FSEPLRTNLAGDRANLSPVEIIKLTNMERTKLGVSGLSRNVLLDQAATAKLQDMFDRQYFDHVSPDGKGPGFLATQAGYTYVVVGENLAMGTFDTDAALVEAWMKSQGHRENILNARFTEIGVAVGHGTYNGERIWIAVQEFGKPTSECPSIDTELRDTIEKDKIVVADLQAKINQQKKDLETMSHDTPAESAAYNQKVAAYNDLVSKYNAEVANLKKEIDSYNQGVRDFNVCAQS